MLEGLGTAVGLEGANFVAFLAATAAFAIFHLLSHLLQQVGILVGTEDGGLACGDVEVALLGGLLHLVLHISFAEGLAVAAHLLNLHEVLPGAFGNLVGEVLDIVAAGGRVSNLVKVALLFQQQLLVAGNAVAEVVGLLVGVVEGQHRDAVGTGDAGRHGLGGRTQHVDVGVVERLVPFAGGGVDEELVGAVAFGFVLFHDFAPQQAGGTDFCHLHEVGAADAEVHQDIAGGTLHLASALAQACHQLVGGGKAEAKFLHDVRACVVKQVAVDGQHAELGQVLGGVVDELFRHVEVTLFSAVELAVFQCVAEHVEIAGTFQLLGVNALALGIFNIEFQGLEIILRAHEVDAYSTDIDAVEQCRHFVDIVDFAHAESQRGGAAAHGVESHTVGFHGVFHMDVLTHVPHVVARMFAACVGYLTGITVKVFKSLEVLGAVVGLHLEAFNGAPHEFLLVVGPLEVFVDDFLPFLCRNGWEFVEQFVVFHYVVSFICFYL